MNDKHNAMRQLLELALSYGRKHKSSQTGYLHYCYGMHDQEPHLPIPIVENLLYALALLRSRTIENVNEAKGVLEGLLYFQNKRESDLSFGNFPIYLHDFPVCKDRFTGAQAAVAIYWILKLFHQVLGQELNARLEDSLLHLLKHALKTHSEKPAPYHLAIKIAAAAAAGGHLLHQPDIEQKGHLLLDKLCHDPDRTAWYCPMAMGSILTALKMLYPRLENSPWKHFWKHLTETWHYPTGAYAGPAMKVWQKGFEPQTTLYDLFLGYFTGVLSSRALKEAPVHLEAVLIPSCEDLFQEPTYPFSIEGTIGDAKWMMHQERHHAYSLVEQGKVAINPIYENGFQPFRLIWGGHERVHSLVCQGGNSKEMTFTTSPAAIDLWFEMDGPVEIEEREKCRDISFFVDSHAQLDFLIAEGKSSTFRLDEPITIRSGKYQLTLSFHLEKGEGRFLGHRMLGNRPSQLDTKGSRRYEAYDWILFLRTLGRSDKCLIKASLQIEQENP